VTRNGKRSICVVNVKLIAGMGNHAFKLLSTVKTHQRPREFLATENTLAGLGLLGCGRVLRRFASCGRSGCYLPYLWLAKRGPIWLLIPAGVSLALFAWLLTLHDAAAGRVYAAYGGVYIAVALAWLWAIDGVRPSAWDVAGVTVSLMGMGLIAFQPK